MPRSCTEKQAAVLADHGYDPDDFTFDEASEVITEIQENGWEPLPDDHPLAPSNVGREAPTKSRKPKPTRSKKSTKKPSARGRSGNDQKYDPDTCSPRQAAVLQRYDYDPEDFTFQEATDLIQALADNDWQKLDDDGVPNFS